MKLYIIVFVLAVQTTLFSACQVSKIELGPKTEVKSYLEKEFEMEDSTSLNLSCDSSNIEVYVWDEKTIKFEVAKRVRGVWKREELEKDLDNFLVEIYEKENEIIFKSEYRGKNKSPADRNIDLTLYMPKKIEGITLEIGTGNIKFHDNIRGKLNGEIGMANMEVAGFYGEIGIEGNIGNITISSGRLEGETYIKKNIGNICINAKFEEGGNYLFKTDIGNIELALPGDSKISFESIGELEINDFDDFSYDTKAHVETSVGKIAIRKTGE